MDIMMLMLLAVSGICFVSGVLSGMAGFGALIVMVPALLFLMELDVIIPLSVFCGIATQGYNAFSFRRHVPKGSLVKLLLGALPGIWLGGSLLLHMPEAVLRAAMGILLICYVLWSVFSKPRPPMRPPGAVWAYAAGFFCGAFGGAFGINGPPAVVYATRTNWSPQEIRAFLGVFCGMLFVITAITMIARGLVKPEAAALALLAAPTCLLGNYCGLRLTQKMHTDQYIRLLYLLLFIMGVSLCRPALSALIAVCSP
ncbi:MAG: sulfite exporter TauE/SafE family protein [Deltaproteobacteria bacterium]|jgi:uncharacterized membrane protein YfcA|nr:sulfite exporter TauE/SafE family protein [Deltaproteobacteria bacterium]